MAPPARFFSTLAQATAAAVGFVIAFVSSVYAVRKGRANQEIRDFKEEYQYIHEDYNDLFTAIPSGIVEHRDVNVNTLSETTHDILNMDFTSSKRGFDYRKKVDDIIEEKEIGEYGKLWVKIVVSRHLMSDLLQEEDVRVIQNKFSTVRNLLRSLSRESDDAHWADINIGKSDGDSEKLGNIISSAWERHLKLKESHSVPSNSGIESVGPVIFWGQILLATGVGVPVLFLLSFPTPSWSLQTVPQSIPFFAGWSYNQIFILSSQIFLIIVISCLSYKLFSALSEMIDWDGI